MQVSQTMTRGVRVANPEQSICDVAHVVENIGDLQLHRLPVTLARRPVSHAYVRLLRT